MLSMIQGEVVTRYNWLTPQEFTDIVAISQMTPGPIGINSATYVGYNTIVDAGYGMGLGIVGSSRSARLLVLPSFILMLTISRFFLKYQKHPAVEAVFSAPPPAVVGLLASPAALVLMNAENFGSPTDDSYSFLISCIIFLGGIRWHEKIQVEPYRHDYSLRGGRNNIVLRKTLATTLPSS